MVFCSYDHIFQTELPAVILASSVSVHDSEKRKRPRSTCPQASTSQPDPNDEVLPIPAGTKVTLEVRIGPRVFYETVRLPPASMLVISDKLCSLIQELDEAAAKFEYEFVRTLSRRLRTVQEAEDLQVRLLRCNLFHRFSVRNLTWFPRLSLKKCTFTHAVFFVR